jgi:hypothetical protein
MTTFPCLLYRSPGAIRRARYSYNCIAVHDQNQMDIRLSGGWFTTLDAAIEAAGSLATGHLTSRKVKKQRRPVAKPAVERRASVRRAIKAKEQPAPIPEPIPEDDAPPTRAELEEKAKLLGIKFDGRTSNRKLGKLIEEAMK